MHIGDPIVRVSAANGETGVSLRREAVIDFSGPLGSKELPPSAILAQFGGRVLPGRLRVSRDARTVRLFYEEDLPASA